MVTRSIARSSNARPSTALPAKPVARCSGAIEPEAWPCRRPHSADHAKPKKALVGRDDGVLPGTRYPAERSGRALAELLVKMTRAEATHMDGFLTTLHSASSVTATGIGRDKTATHHLKTVTSALNGKLPAKRAALLLAMVSGFQVMRQMSALPALANANEAELAQLPRQVFDQLVQSP
ncbi:TetR/AcrR family transcriptional regulator [Pseudoxanthomonas wuyuanensis]